MRRVSRSVLVAVAIAAMPASSMAQTAPPFVDATAPEPTAAPRPTTPAELEAMLRRVAAQLTPQTGDIRIPSANAVLHLGEDYYFLPAAQARLVLVDAWGNPQSAAANVLGIVFPAGKTFTDDTWGAVITFERSGYVTDDDAEAIDYQELLAQIQESEPEINAQRTAQGYPAQHLVGWAQPPVYDRANHSVVWAQNVRIDGDPEHTLNYDIRMLGRHGVLSLNMITLMSKLPETRQAAERFARAAEFESGARYADFQNGDRVAEYGVAGLVATGVGAAAAKKAGLLAGLLLILKKFGVLIIAGIAAAWAGLRRVFRREEEPVYYADPEYAAEAGHDDDAADHVAEPEPRAQT